ncbi:MAG: type II toxin-antitoxin system VapC family toxin [Deltaproteobacteria bacterium]|nr:type II toxin-antitoxin system VapC family toxin [Deltaproteobacteria bacterium]
MILLDTHVWLWWLHDPEKLSARARKAIAGAEKAGEVLISAISVWEIAVKVGLGKLSLPMDIYAWFQNAEKYPGTAIESLTPVDAIASTLLPGVFHKDPSDRMIIALARRHGIPLVTTDKKILEYPHVETIW